LRNAFRGLEIPVERAARNDRELSGVDDDPGKLVQGEVGVHHVRQPVPRRLRFQDAIYVRRQIRPQRARICVGRQCVIGWLIGQEERQIRGQLRVGQVHPGRR
jgi:hypothetical protein